MSSGFKWMVPLCRVYGVLLYAYPKAFRAQFGGEMQQLFRDGFRATAQAPGGRLIPFLFLSLKDWFTTALRERFSPVGWKAVARHPVAIWMLAIFLCLSASATVLRAYVIPTGSMEGNLRIGDHILVDRLPSQAGDVRRGDMLVFRFPEDTQQTYIKRVIGLPGDRIRMSGKQVIRNGRRLVEPYAQHVAASTDSYRDNFPAAPPPVVSTSGRDMLDRHVENGEAIVPLNSFFVLGDNRDISYDSRYWGFVPCENVVGKPWIVFWSYDAPPQDLAEWNVRHVADLARHFFTKTRWSRTLFVLRSMPAEEVAP